MSAELDIYTKRKIVTRSDEHIVLNALGGRRTHPLIDKTTNDVFGSTIDAALAKSLNALRVLLDAKSGDGRSPPAERDVTSHAGEKYSLLPGGKAEVAKPQVEFTQTPDGKMLVSGTARSMKELRNLTRRKLGELNVPLEAVEAGATTVESPVPRLRFALGFLPQSWRAMAKMLCNLLAVERRELFLDDGFDPIRNFVLHGGQPWDFVAVNTVPAAVGCPPEGLGELDHLLVVRGDHETGAVLGLIVLYGHLQFVVQLGVATFAESFVTSYRVDQMGAADRFNAAHDTKVGVPVFVPLSIAGQSAWFETVEAAMNRVMPVAMAAVDRRTLRDLISKSMKETFGEGDGQPITEKNIADFANAVTERYLRAFVDRRDDDDDVPR